ncbi:hypothetical protein ANN_28055 [Periplaneta americana]|uniref:Uncharacterized protein n=1 Tax=Periplaneta americana TaxID=6978 RepID=A0ABQ8RUT6_PERAM|nr:hypothetical protein ANN_28055 [Periplaneta americana]
MPAVYVKYKKEDIPFGMELADPTFNKPGKIDLLIGAELFFQILRPEARVDVNDSLSMHNTKLGDNLEQQLQRFWELEDIPERTRTTEECEKHFVATTTRNQTGRFVVRLPQYPNHQQLGESFEEAYNRLQQMERCFQGQPLLQEEYCKFMTDYEQLGHMREIDTKKEEEDKASCYLPHHAVFKNSGEERNRVVDASSKTTEGTLSAPFQAIQCLQMPAEEISRRYPLASNSAERFLHE